MLETDSKQRQGRQRLFRCACARTLLSDRIEAHAAKGQVRAAPMRVMVLGIPECGQVHVYQQGGAGARQPPPVDRPGVTRGKQWITVDQGLELLDTPGILWPQI